MVTFTREQMRTLQCLRDWLVIRAEAGYGLPTSVNELWEAVDHSALLRRLLAGSDPLPTPPPLSFGQPWYELSEHGFAKCMVERVSDELEINGTRWQILDERGEHEFLVARSDDSATYLVWKMAMLSTDGSRTSWIIERVLSAVA